MDRALALGIYESRRCPNCHNWNALVPLDSIVGEVAGADHDGQKVEVASYRCVFCSASDRVKRDEARAHEKVEPIVGQAFWTDGLMYAARPPTEEVT